MFKRYSILLLLCGHMVIAQSPSSVQVRLNHLVKYTDVKIPNDTLKQWVDLIEIAESIDEPVPDRNKAWKRFLLSLYNHMDIVPNAIVSPQVLEAWSQYLTFPFLKGRIYDLKAHQKTKPKPKVISTSGQGSKPLLLIPPLGFSSKPFEVFKKTYRKDFDFIEVSFPTGVNAYPYPEYMSFEEAPWLSSVKSDVIEHLTANVSKPIFIVAMGNGLYTALQVAMAHPELVKGIITIDGQYRSRMLDPETGNYAGLEYRKNVARRAFPTSMVIQISPGNMAPNYAFTKDAGLNQEYLNEITPEVVNSIFRYNQEFRAQDLITQFDKLKTPILSLVSKHDDQSTMASNLGVARNWKALELQFPDHKISVVTVPDSRALIYVDQPELFNYYFQRFLKNPADEIKSFSTETITTLDRPSPAASTSQVIAATNLRVTYSRPAKNGREVFGKLVPYGQVWRAGANEATTFEASNDVLIEGQLLKAGRYSLFAIPSEGSWEIIFNRIPDQWGAFNYNLHHDALRIKVIPKNISDIQEYLSYRFDRLTSTAVDLVLKWDNLSVSFNIKEHFELPAPPKQSNNWDWKLLLTDQKGDGANPTLTDGKALSYLQKGDSLWFKFDLHSYDNSKAFALNLLIDTDNDQSTGAPWFGQNTSFVFDKALTLWMRKSGNGFQGLHGVMNPADFASGTASLETMNNMTYYLDQKAKFYMIRVHVDDIGATGKMIRIIGAVGEFRAWNDDIGDQESALINLK